MVQNVIIRRPELQFAHPGLFFPKPTITTLTASSLRWALWFNKKSGESNEAAAMRGSFNKKEGAANNDIDRRWPGGFPAFEENYARFTEATPLVTNIPDFGSGGGCFFTVCRTQDTTITGSPAIGFVHGTYGGNTNKGFGFEFNSVTSSVARVVDYPASGSVVTNQIDMGTGGATDMEKWRIYYGETGRVSGGNQLLAAMNLNPGDGTTPDPTDTTITGGRAVGAQTWSFGGRVGDGGTSYTGTIHKDIAVTFGFAALPSTDERAAFAAQVAAFCARVGITIGSA